MENDKNVDPRSHICPRKNVSYDLHKNAKSFKIFSFPKFFNSTIVRRSALKSPSKRSNAGRSFRSAEAS